MNHDAQKNWEETVEWVGIVAGCLLEKDGKYLLVQEKQKKAYGLWNLPAGFTDKGETIEDAATRETKEESGFDVKITKKLGVYHEKTGIPVIHIFSAQITGGEMTLDEDELLDIKWHTIQEIEQLDSEGKLRNPYILPAIHTLKMAAT